MESQTTANLATIPCKYCNRRFVSLQALDTHEKAHKLEQAMANRKKQILQPRSDQCHGLIGVCERCMDTTEFGARVNVMMAKVCLHRLIQQKLAMGRVRTSVRPMSTVARAHADMPETVSIAREVPLQSQMKLG